MCGIIGYIGDRNADKILINSLKALEYRGYDSAGISILEHHKINTIKNLGRVSNLEEEVKLNNFTGTIGIGHTRWATHGVPSTINSHPHLNVDKSLSIVHNGIIENYLELKKELISEGYQFVSDTDTEVIVLLIDSYFKKNNNLLYSFNKAVARLQGSYALALIYNKINQIYAVKKDSPLIIGIGKNENFLGSDVSAMIEYTNDFIYLEDNEFLILDRETAIIYDKEGNLINKEIKHLNLSKEDIQKNGFSHFMLKEIFEQPRIVQNILKSRVINNAISFDDIKLNEQFLKSINKIYLIGCGTAYYAGLVGKYLLDRFTDYNIISEVASEFRYNNRRIDSQTLIIIVSQSGETADSLAALREAKRLGAKSLGIVNVIGSSIAREVDNVIYTFTGPEIAVASTKAYSAQVLSLMLLSIYLGRIFGKISVQEEQEYVKSLLELPSSISNILSNNLAIESVAKKYSCYSNVFFIGRGSDYFSGLEGALKLKEISYIQSEAYPAGELKHGPIAMISKKSLVIALATRTDLVPKIHSNIMEVKTRGASVFLISNKSNEIVDNSIDDKFLIDDNNYLFMPILINVVQQLFSFYAALSLGHDIDKPRNLAKSVTVE